MDISKGRRHTQNRNKTEQLERQMSEVLTEGEMRREDPDQAARRQLPYRYEYRVQAQTDPIVEETLRYREMAEEADDRYDAYMEQASKQASGQVSEHAGRKQDSRPV